MKSLEEKKCGSRKNSKPTFPFCQSLPCPISLKRYVDTVQDLDLGNTAFLEKLKLFPSGCEM